MGPLLARHGLFMVGLDLIGDVVCELNVFSPGGLPDLERFTGKPFTRVLIDRVLETVARKASERAAS